MLPDGRAVPFLDAVTYHQTKKKAEQRNGGLPQSGSAAATCFFIKGESFPHQLALPENLSVTHTRSSPLLLSLYIHLYHRRGLHNLLSFPAIQASRPAAY